MEGNPSVQDKPRRGSGEPIRKGREQKNRGVGTIKKLVVIIELELHNSIIIINQLQSPS